MGTIILEQDGETTVSNNPTGDLRGDCNIWFEPYTPEGTLDLGAATVVIQARRNIDSAWIPLKSFDAASLAATGSQVHKIDKAGGAYQLRAVITGDDTDTDLKIIVG